MTEVLSCLCASLYIQNNIVCTHEFFCHFISIKIEHLTSFDLERNNKKERSLITPCWPPVAHTLSDVIYSLSSNFSLSVFSRIYLTELFTSVCHKHNSWFLSLLRNHFSFIVRIALVYQLFFQGVPQLRYNFEQIGHLLASRPHSHCQSWTKLGAHHKIGDLGRRETDSRSKILFLTLIFLHVRW